MILVKESFISCSTCSNAAPQSMTLALNFSIVLVNLYSGETFEPILSEIEDSSA